MEEDMIENEWDSVGDYIPQTKTKIKKEARPYSSKHVRQTLDKIEKVKKCK